MNRYDRFANVQRDWTPPRELRHSTPRAVRLSPCGIALVALGAALVLGAAAVAVLAGRASGRQAEEVRLLQTEGVDIDARIVRLWRTSGEGKSYRAEYRYRADGRTYQKKLKVPERIWKTLEPGGTMALRYLPANPDVHHPRAWNKRPLSIWIAILIPAGMIVLALLTPVALYRQVGLLAEGRPAPAVVTKLKRVQRAPHGGRVTIVHYEFHAMSGGIVEGKGDNRKGAVPGAIFCAIYDPNDPRRNALYPLSLVRVEENR